MQTAYIVMLVSCASRREAGKVRDALLRKRLVACASIAGGVSSKFRWKGALAAADEVLLVMKTLAGHFPAAARCVKAAHSYEVPEIVALPIAGGDAAYLRWIRKSVAPLATKRKAG